jgi:DNA-binding NarL/FixJ family response regulator
VEPRKKVLIADVHPLVRRGLAQIIEECGFVVVDEVGTGRCALESVRRLKPDIVVADQLLSELNGTDLTIALRKDYPDVAVLICTSQNNEAAIYEALRAGVRGYVLKGDPSPQVAAALHALAQGHAYFSPAVSERLLRLVAEVAPHGSPLTYREREVVQLVSEGNQNKQIAIILNVNVKTVETHRKNALVKLSLRTTADLVRYAVRNCLVAA